MIKSAYFPNRTFETKQELFEALKFNKDKLIGLKKATIKNSDGILFNTIKSIEPTFKGIDLEDGFSYHVINTTKYMDSHSDVHLNGIWNKSIVDQEGKIYFVEDHNISIKTVIAYPENLEMMLKNLTWKSLGKDFEGETQALIFKINKDNIESDDARKIIEKNRSIEHSIRMQYVKIDLAIDEGSEGYEEEKALFDNTIGVIANKAQAIEQGYFWVVSEAKISQEGSMVLRGSNDVTPILTQEQKQEKTKTETKTEKKFNPFLL